jgi:sulfur carrier protein
VASQGVDVAIITLGALHHIRGWRGKRCGSVSAMPAKSVEIFVNGSARSINAGATVADLIGELGLAGKPVAVERNLEVVPKAQHAATILAEGDRLELVTFVGGG